MYYKLQHIYLESISRYFFLIIKSSFIPKEEINQFEQEIQRYNDTLDSQVATQRQVTKHFVNFSAALYSSFHILHIWELVDINILNSLFKKKKFKHVN